MTYYKILEGKDKGKIVRVENGLGEILNDKWEPYNALDILFGEIETEIVTEDEC